jgi:hypothetical protein
MKRKSNKIKTLDRQIVEMNAEYNRQIVNMDAEYKQLKSSTHQIIDDLTEQTSTYKNCLAMIGHKELGNKIEISGLVDNDRTVKFTLDQGMIKLMITVLRIIDDSVAFSASAKAEATLSPPLSARGAAVPPRKNKSGSATDFSPATKISKLNIERAHEGLAKILYNAFPPVNDSSLPKISRTFDGKLILLMYSTFDNIAHSSRFQALFDRMRRCAQSDDSDVVNRIFANSNILRLYELMQKVFIYNSDFNETTIRNLSTEDIQKIPIYTFIYLMYPDLFSGGTAQYDLWIMYKYFRTQGLVPDEGA